MKNNIYKINHSYLERVLLDINKRTFVAKVNLKNIRGDMTFISQIGIAFGMPREMTESIQSIDWFADVLEEWLGLNLHEQKKYNNFVLVLFGQANESLIQEIASQPLSRTFSDYIAFFERLIRFISENDHPNADDYIANFTVFLVTDL